MATPKSQRIGIIIIAIVMVVGTIGSFVAMILATENQATESQRRQAVLDDYQKKYEEYQNRLDKQSKELSKKYYPIFKKYADTPAKFDLDSVKKLRTKDLRTGSGKVIDDETEYAAYYIGWNPDGKVFDQSIDDGSLKAPIDPSLGLIEGWSEGVKGMKIGGVRLLEIPSDKAYGEDGQGDDIPPNTPLKFVVMAIEKPAELDQPEFPAELYGGL